ncbi:unnamed protein product [Rhodiola kirilowii]
MDNSSQWPQGFGVVKAVDHIPSSSGSIDQQQQQQQQKRTLATRPQKDQAVNCPRCNSVNTKFCYYNNYSLSQPRYFCKTCRRYWTAGGSLRNVPVGGGSRKNRRSSSAATSSSSVLTAAAAQAQAQAVANNLSSSVILHQGHDLNLSFPPHPTTTHDDLHRHHQQYPINPNLTFSTTKPANFSIDQLSNSKLLSHHLPNTNNSTTNNMTPLLPPMGLFKNSLAGNNESREMMSSFMNPPSISSSASMIFSSSGFPPNNHQDQFKPSSLNFSLDGFSGGGGGGGGSDDGYASSLQLGVQHNIIDHGSASSGGARLLFPFNQENVNKEQVPAAASSHVDQFDHPHNRSSSSVQGGGGGDGSISAGFWTGMLSGGSW